MSDENEKTKMPETDITPFAEKVLPTWLILVTDFRKNPFIYPSFTNCRQKRHEFFKQKKNLQKKRQKVKKETQKTGGVYDFSGDKQYILI